MIQVAESGNGSLQAMGQHPSTGAVDGQNFASLSQGAISGTHTRRAVGASAATEQGSPGLFLGHSLTCGQANEDFYGVHQSSPPQLRQS